MSQNQITLSWRAGAIETALAESLNSCLITKLDSEPILWSYLEWRPGSNPRNDAHPALLTKGKVNHPGSIPLDELRLFTANGGLKAFEDSGRTCWMQWKIAQPLENSGESAWKAQEVSKKQYPIQLLNREAASRFGLHPDTLPPQEKLNVTEYLRAGALFCWALGGGNLHD